MLALKHISKTFQQRKVLDDISITFPDTGLIGIQGQSGCGKSTLLYIIGMLDQDFTGDILFQGEKIVNREAFIRQHLSYVMQSKDVISSLNVKENIQLAARVSGKRFTSSQLKKIVSQLELTSLLHQYPHQLSGGQLKRVSLAKALLKQSSIVLCDEPTGALHQGQAHEVMALLKKLSMTSLIIIVSHDPVLLKKYCDSVLTLKAGKLVGNIKDSKRQVGLLTSCHFYSLWIYPVRQLIYQKGQLMFLFVFQWIIIVAFALIVTGFQGIFDAIEQSEAQAVQAHILKIEKKDGTAFDSMLSHQDIVRCSYVYDLLQLEIFNHQEKITCNIDILPTQTSHLSLQQGRVPSGTYEVLVTEKLYQKLADKESLQITYQDYQADLMIVGVLSPDLFSQDEIYCHWQIESMIPFLKDDYTLVLETKSDQTQTLYQTLQADYFVESDVIERSTNYQSLLSLARTIAYVFVGISLLISLLLIGIVESTIYFERKHDVAYLLSLGLNKKRLFLLSVCEALFLGLIMGVGGSVLSFVVYYYIEYIYRLSEHYYFHLQLHALFIYRYDLFVVICLIYMLMTMLGSLLPIRKMMKTDMIEVLREE